MLKGEMEELLAEGKIAQTFARVPKRFSRHFGCVLPALLFTSNRRVCSNPDEAG